jgi:hypothetical protein
LTPRSSVPRNSLGAVAPWSCLLGSFILICCEDNNFSRKSKLFSSFFISSLAGIPSASLVSSSTFGLNLFIIFSLAVCTI